MIRTLHTLLLALLLVAPLALGGCFHHQHGRCHQPCQMQQTNAAPPCQTPCPNCPCKAAAPAAPAVDIAPATK